MTKKTPILLLLLFVSVLSLQAQKKKQVDSLSLIHTHLKEKNFFKAQEIFNAYQTCLSSVNQLWVGALLDNAFNRLGNSNEKIKSLLADDTALLADTARLKLLTVMHDNSFKLFKYRKAQRVLDSILIRYPHLLSQKESDDLKNSHAIVSALKNIPVQKVEMKDNQRFKIYRDKAGLPNLALKKEQDSILFIFDTGANISTITESTARRFDMDILETSIEVGSITGEKIISRLAYSPLLKLGDIEIENAVFLVFKDADLSFPQLDYQINGILGFPIICALKEIQITKNDEFIVSAQPTYKSRQNMALSDLTPIIQIGDEHFTFDSGAATTQLYLKYLNKYKKEITGKYKPTEVKFGGAGGMVTEKAYVITFTPKINNKEVVLNKVSLLIEGNEQPARTTFYGNIGQDLIKKFDTLTVNFESMFIDFN